MFKSLKCDISKNLVNWGFICATIITAALSFTSGVYTDVSNGKNYSVFEALFSFDRDFMRGQFQFSPLYIINGTLNGYYESMALPVTAAFPFVFAFTAERNSGNMRQAITRVGRRKYYFSKFISALLCGGLCTMLGVIVFAVFVLILFPSMPPEMLVDLLPDGVFLTLVKKALSAFVYGAVSVLPAFILCSFCTNPYIILCVPFMLKFMLETLISRIQSNAFAAGNYEIYDMTAPFMPNSASQLFYARSDNVFWITVGVNLIFTAAVFAGFYIVMEKRADRGE